MLDELPLSRNLCVIVLKYNHTISAECQLLIEHGECGEGNLIVFRTQPLLFFQPANAPGRERELGGRDSNPERYRT